MAKRNSGTRAQRRHNSFFGKYESKAQPARSKKIIDLLPEEVDFSPNSSDWFPFVDFHYIIHHVEDNAFIMNRYQHELAIDNGEGFFAGVYKLAQLPSSGPNVYNYLISRALFLHHSVSEGNLTTEDLLTEKRRLHEHGMGIVKSANPQDKKDIDDFYHRIFMHTKDNFFTLISKFVPFLPKGKFMSKHMKMQERFNVQTRRSEKVHKSLDELLSGDLTEKKSKRKFLETARKIDYDLGAFQEVAFEEAFFRKVQNLLYFEGKGEEMRLYGDILEQRRTSADLVRNFVMRGVCDSIEAALELYDRVDNITAKEIFADRFLRNVDIGSYIQKVVGSYSVKHVREMVESGVADFETAYGQVGVKILSDMDLTARVRRYAERFEKALKGNNVDFLVESIGNNEVFKRKLKFDKVFGTRKDADSLYDLIETCKERKYFRVKKVINPGNIDNWMDIADSGLMVTCLEISPDEFCYVAAVANIDSEKAITMLSFLREYDETISLVDSRRSVEGVNLGRRIEILRDARYNVMEDHLNHVVEIDEERTKRRLYKALKTKNMPESDPVRMLIQTDKTFVMSYLEVLKEVRRECLSHGGDGEYIVFVQDLLQIGSTEGRESLVNDYSDSVEDVEVVDVPDGSSKIVYRERTKKTDVVLKKAEKKKAKKVKLPPMDISVPCIDKLVIVGGLPGVNYSARLSDQFSIGKLTVYTSDDLNKLTGASADSAYIIITSNIPHSMRQVVQDMTSHWAYSPTHGKNNLILATGRLYESIKK